MCYLVLPNHFSLLHLLNSDHFPCFLVLAHSDFSESSSADDFERLEVSGRYFGSPIESVKPLGVRQTVKFSLFVLDFLLYEVLLSLRQIHFIHLLHQLIPC
jgi:hypothetical protein